MATHAPITGAPSRAPVISAPPAAVTRILSRFDRDQLAGFISVAIDLLDMTDGDPDLEDGTDVEDDFVLSASANGYAEGRGPGCEISDAGGCEHDGREPDDDAEDGNGAEDEPCAWFAAMSNGPGCAISDPDSGAGQYD